MAKAKDAIAQYLIALASVGIASAILLLALALAGCAITNIVTTGNTSGIRSPAVNQWVSFGGGSPPIAGTMFSFPSVSSGQYMGYVYTGWPFKPQLGQTVTLTYDLIANNPVWVQNPNNNPPDTNPPTISLFLWRSGDDLSCDWGTPDYDHYRLFTGHVNLQVGTGNTLSAVLDPTVWQGCYPNQPGNPANLTAAGMQDVLNNLVGVGFTIGGQSFDGHGVAIAGGTALFYIRGLTIN